jgi:hypothetical protein
MQALLPVLGKCATMLLWTSNQRWKVVLLRSQHRHLRDVTDSSL